MGGHGTTSRAEPDRWRQPKVGTCRPSPAQQEAPTQPSHETGADERDPLPTLWHPKVPGANPVYEMTLGTAQPLTIFTTAVNFVLGAGVLGIPCAVASAGLLASALSLVIVACLSLLTCSWLLETGDRANALQNEVSRTRRGSRVLEVRHVHGGASFLPPAASFCNSSLSQPLLGRKLDEYRAAYRSWRQGSHQGARDSQLRKLRPLLTYQAGRHRELLPLQLLPPPRAQVP